MTGGKNRRTLFILLLILSIFCTLTAVMAQDDGVVVQVDGSATIKDGDLVKARDVAISDALRNAVQKVVGTLVDSQTQVKDFELLNDSILTKSTGYVSDYQVVDSKQQGGILTVTVKVTVQKNAVINKLDDLKIRVIRAGKPRVMVVVTEKYHNQATTDLSAEAALISGLLDVDFPVVDRDQVKEARNKELLQNVSPGDPNAVRQVAADYGAEILIIGEANCDNAGTISGFISCRATVTVKVIRADTGNILDTYTAQGAGADISEGNAAKKAFTNAGTAVSNYLKNALPSKLATLQNTIQISVSGITFKEFRLLENDLKSTSLVSNVYAREFGNGNARFDVDTGLKPVQLADELEQFKDLPLEVVNVSGSKIEAKKVM